MFVPAYTLGGQPVCTHKPVRPDAPRSAKCFHSVYYFNERALALAKLVSLIGAEGCVFLLFSVDGCTDWAKWNIFVGYYK